MQVAACLKHDCLYLLLQLRLTPEQNDAKRDAEQAVKEVEDEVLAETDESKQEGLKAELASRKEKLSSLMDGFQVSINHLLELCSLGACNIQDMLKPS